MAQFVRPSADLVTSAEWTATPYFSKIDDAGDAGADSVVINNPSPETTDIIAVDGSSATDPVSSDDHIIRARFRKVSGGGVVRLTIELREGYVDEGDQGTLITTAVLDTSSTSLVTLTSVLTGGEADSITDYSDLQFRVWASRDNGSTGRSTDIEYIEFEVPDADGGGEAHSGGSTAQVSITSEGAGTAARSGGSDTQIDVTAEGAGTAARAGGAGAQVDITAEGAGSASRSGSSEATVTVGAQGSGRKAASGGSTAQVSVTAEGGGSSAETTSGGSTAGVTVISQGGGVKATAAGSTSTVDITSEGAGRKGASGGSTASIEVTAQGGGSAAGTASGGSTAQIEITSEGAGTAHRAGGSTAQVGIDTTGSGSKTSEGGSTANITVTATGGGSGSETEQASGGSTALVAITADGAGSKTTSGASTANIVVTAFGAGEAHIEAFAFPASYDTCGPAIGSLEGARAHLDAGERYCDRCHAAWISTERLLAARSSLFMGAGTVRDPEGEVLPIMPLRKEA
jgi:hypothetical protein